MAKYTFVVLTNAVEGKDDAFDEWYTNTHLGDVLAVPGFVSAQRFKLTDVQRAKPPHPFRYLALYESKRTTYRRHSTNWANGPAHRRWC